MTFPRYRHFKVTFPPNLLHVQDFHDPTPVPSQFLDTDIFTDLVHDHPEDYEKQFTVHINYNFFREFVLDLNHDDEVGFDSFALDQPVVANFVKPSFEDIDAWQSIGTKWGLAIVEVEPGLDGSN